jgi:2-polyprenyl-6-methoxyphenol hydroxylase-like FAD-dependent oxidoreductase
MKVAVVGAGPAGLFFSRLLKRAQPSADVQVFEQGLEGATWGFGVGLGGRSMREIEALDPRVHAAIVAAMVFGSDQNIHLNGEDFAIEYSETMGAIERLALLRILAAAARECGVVLRYNVRVESAEELTGFDLIVAADGIGSSLRKEREKAFGTHIRELSNRFAWYGVGTALRPSALVFRTVPAGRLIGHYYAYTPRMSTFVAECDDATWRAAGFESLSNEGRRATVARIFAPELQGEPLIDNRSIWRRFPVVTNERWYAGNVVLIGDALRSAHFSIGSGTRLAMEDAAVLAAALQQADGDIARALPRFAALRAPARETIGEAARRSFEWYEEIAAHMDQPLLPFIYTFLTRTGRIDDERLKQYAPGFFKAYSQHRDAGLPRRSQNKEEK